MAVKTASEMTYAVSSGALNSIPTLALSVNNWYLVYRIFCMQMGLSLLHCIDLSLLEYSCASLLNCYHSFKKIQPVNELFPGLLG